MDQNEIVKLYTTKDNPIQTLTSRIIDAASKLKVADAEKDLEGIMTASVELNAIIQLEWSANIDALAMFTTEMMEKL